MSNHFALSISRLFAVIVNLSQQSPSVEPVLTSFLSLLDDLLLLKNLKVDIESIDLTLVGWLLLLLAHVLDACIVQCKPSATAVGKENNFLFVGILFWVACTSKKDKMADAWPKGSGFQKLQFSFLLSDDADTSKVSNGKNGATSTSSKSKSSKSSKSSKTSKRSRWDFMLPMPSSQPASSTSDISSYRYQRTHKLMSKYALPKKTLTESQLQQSIIKGNGKQAYKVMAMALEYYYTLLRFTGYQAQCWE